MGLLCPYPNTRRVSGWEGEEIGTLPLQGHFYFPEDLFTGEEYFQGGLQQAVLIFLPKKCPIKLTSHIIQTPHTLLKKMVLYGLAFYIV